MIRRTAFVLCLAFGLPTLIGAQAEPLKQAELAWSQRAQEGNTAKAVALWKQAYQLEPQRTEILIQLAKASGRAYRHATKKSDRVHWAEEARRWAEQAAAKRPQDSMAHAFLGEALGQWAEARKGVRSLKFVKQAVASLKKAVQLDPANWYAHMLLAQFFSKAPKVMSVGDPEEALKEARLAVETGPDQPITHLTLAQILRDQGKKDEARTHLEKLLTLSPPGDRIPESLADQNTARQLLKQDGFPVPTEPAKPTEQSSCEEQGGLWKPGTTEASECRQ